VLAIAMKKRCAAKTATIGRSASATKVARKTAS
jgi:hypothetical protein